jgi:hypothetical protein
MTDLVKNDVFLGQKGPASWSCSCCMAIYYDIHKENQILNFFLKILTFPNFLNLRASTDVESGQNFQLEPGKNPIRT